MEENSLSKIKSSQTRHFKALMIKNAINWKRTPVGSVLEMACPVFLMILLVVARWWITPDYYGDFDLYQLKLPLYPLTSLVNNTWRSDISSVLNTTRDYNDFFTYTNYSQQIQIAGNRYYSPYLDVGSPLFFFPPHCYLNNNIPFTSPLIAYIEQGNLIEQDMIEQLQLLFNTQQQLAKLFLTALNATQTTPGQIPQALIQFLGFDQLIKVQLQNIGVSPVVSSFLVNVAFRTPSANATTNSTLTANSTRKLQVNGQDDKRNQIGQQQNDTSTNYTDLLQQIRKQLNVLSTNYTDFLQQIEQLNVPSLNQTDLLKQIEQQLNVPSTNYTDLLQQIGQLNVTSTNYNDLLQQIGQQLNATSTIYNDFQQQIGQQLNVPSINYTDLLQQIGINSTWIQTGQNILNGNMSVQSINTTSLLKQIGLNDTQIQVINQINNYLNSSNPIAILNDTVLLQKIGLNLNQTKLIQQFQSIGNSTFSGINDTTIQQIGLNIGLNQTQVKQIQELYNVLALNQSFSQTDLLQFTGLNSTQLDYIRKTIQTQGRDVTFNSLNDTGFFQDLDQSQVKLLQVLIESVSKGLSFDTLNNTGLLRDVGLSSKQIEFLSDVFSFAKSLRNNSFFNATLSQIQNLKKLTELFNGTDKIDQFGNFSFISFDSKQSMDAYIQDKNYGQDSKPSICFGFSVNENSPSDYEIELFFNDLFPGNLRGIPNQKQLTANPTTQLPQLRDYGVYTRHGFANMENWFANTVLKRVTGKEQAQILAIVSPFKMEPYTQDDFSKVLQMTLVFFMLLMYIPAIYRTVYRIVAEKSSKAKESMRMMGMKDFSYWSSWFVYYTLVNFGLSSLSWVVLTTFVFVNSSSLLLFLMFFIYGQSIFGLILIAQSLFTTPRAAGVITTIVYFGSSLFRIFIKDADAEYITKLIICMFVPTVAMCETGATFAQFEVSGPGVNFQTYDMYWNNFSVRDGLCCMTFGGTLMFLLGIYLEQVMPKTFGVQKKPCFCFESKKKPVKSNKVDKSIDEIRGKYFETKYLDQNSYEPINREQSEKEANDQILKIEDLFKIYENGFQAVNGVNLKMFADQIFVLLGHNGAGKTTTISMLTGLFGATKGQAEIFGTDIFNKMDQVRQIMGVCPQHDVLFELLTVEEHLSFFYDLKGADPNKDVKKEQIERLMRDVGVDDKRNGLAGQLSGGNKRKLSVAIALCGGSKFIVLDEPTSGMDLSARRQLWNMLKKYKKGRIVLLTTHYMDEADILGDRIGIMAAGKLTCLGSSIFLKNKFGVGYNLTIVKDSSEPNNKIMQYIHEHLGYKVKKQSEIQVEMTIQIPHEYSILFAKFFALFDYQLENLGITSYGMSMSTLEEVFLKVGHLPSLDEVNTRPASASSNNKPVDYNEIVANVRPPSGSINAKTVDHNDADEHPSLLLSGTKLADVNGAFQEDLSNDLEVNTVNSSKLSNLNDFNMKDNVKDLDESFLSNLKAVFFKRINNYKRNKRALLSEVIIPSSMMMIGVSLARLTYTTRSPSIIFDIGRYPTPQQIMINPQPVIASNLTIDQFVSCLSNRSAFNVTYSDWNQNNNSFRDFGMQVFQLGKQQSSIPYMYGAYQMYEADLENQQYKFVSFVNTTSTDVVGLFPEFMYESILRVATKNPDFKYKIRSTPYPLIEYNKIRFQITDAATVVFMTAIAYSMIVTSVISYLVTERVNGLKHLQLISGMQLKSYWVGNFVFDTAKMLITILMTIGMFFAYGMNYNAAWITYLIIPFAILPFTYVVSFIFTTDSAAQVFTMFGHFMTILLLSTIVFALRLSLKTERIGDFTNWIFRLIPTYNLSSSVYFNAAGDVLSQVRATTNGTGAPIDPNVWNINNCSGDIMMEIFHLCFWVSMLIVVEKGYFIMLAVQVSKQKQENITIDPTILDQDVINEQERLKNKNVDDDIIVKNLRKVYKQKLKNGQTHNLVAVSDLSFALKAGECFALLGVNGAGKSTCFKSLTCEVQPTSGQISIGGFDVHEDFEKARKLIGYCPQPNLVFQDMSVQEHIEYYAHLKGISMSKRKDIVEQTIQELGLDQQRFKAAGTLSGGNQRKLCVAQALIGSPPIVFLDEPSAGMDPEARRFMWSVVAKIAQRKTSAVVLTTHSMDEAEALSTKMGIMVKGGTFKCFGSSQHIKNKFGTGYAIEIKVKNLMEEDFDEVRGRYFKDGEILLGENFQFSDKIIELITQNGAKTFEEVDRLRSVHNITNLLCCIHELCLHFEVVELLERYDNYMKIRVEKMNKTIGSVFGLVEKLKLKYSVGEYSVSQTTLEQIFQSFANLAYDENVQHFKLNEVGKLTQDN